MPARAPAGASGECAPLAPVRPPYRGPKGMILYIGGLCLRAAAQLYR